MLGAFVNRAVCRFCCGEANVVLHLGNDFGLAGAFLRSADEITDEKIYPLSLQMCTACKYFQCQQVVPSDELFRKGYFYYSSMISSLVRHFDAFSEWIEVRYPKSSKIVEIGCNDGVLLHALLKRGYTSLIGVDPSDTILAVNPAIHTLQDYFNDITAARILEKHGQADIFISCNSFAHIDDMRSIFLNIKQILNPKTGMALIEVHDSSQIFKDMHFDFIYHEHMGYYTVTSMTNACALFGMRLVDVENIANHGGSLRCSISVSSESSPSVAVTRALEREQPIFASVSLSSFEKRIYNWRENIEELVSSLHSQGMKIYGYGASGRANTILGFCKRLNRCLLAIVDDAPSKIGCLTPRYHISIKPSSALYTDNVTHVLLLAWTYSSSILQSHSAFLTNGGTFILPLPSIKIESGSRSYLVQ